MESSIKFYIKDDVKYIIHFPEEWFPHIGNSGPIHCEKCRTGGMIHDIFIFYCPDCLINVYTNKRGTPEFFNLIRDELNLEDYIKIYYKLIKNNIYCYGCSDVLSSEDIKKGYDDKDENLLCY